MIIQDEECCSHESTTSLRTSQGQLRLRYCEREEEDSSTSRRSRKCVCIPKLLLISVNYYFRHIYLKGAAYPTSPGPPQENTSHLFQGQVSVDVYWELVASPKKPEFAGVDQAAGSM